MTKNRRSDDTRIELLEQDVVKIHKDFSELKKEMREGFTEVNQNQKKLLTALTMGTGFFKISAKIITLVGTVVAIVYTILIMGKQH